MAVNERVIMHGHSTFVLVHGATGDESAYDEGLPNPMARESIEALYEPIHITPERWGSIRRFYIEAMRDDSITYEVEEKMLERQPVEKIYEINCGHCPQATMVQELHVILHDIARQ